MLVNKTFSKLSTEDFVALKSKYLYRFETQKKLVYV